MKYLGGLIFVMVILSHGCGQQTGSQKEQPKLPFVKTKCVEPPSFLLESMSTTYGFWVMTVTQSEDTIDLSENVLLRGVPLPIFGGAERDSIEKANEESFWHQRMIDIESNFPYLDSFSILIDTTNQVCNKLFIRGWNNDEPTRSEVTRSYPVFIKNLSPDTVQISEYSGVELEILSKKNTWETIVRDNLRCGTGVIEYWIAPKETIVVLVPVTDGKYSRTMRVKLGDNCSSTFQANCNFKY